MKKAISMVLIFAMMLAPVYANALGMRERRVFATAGPAEAAEPAATEKQAPTAEPAATAEPFQVSDLEALDLSGLSTEALLTLFDMVYEELLSREAAEDDAYALPAYDDAFEPYETEEGYVLLDRDGVRLTLTGSEYNAEDCMLYFTTIVENENDYSISIGIRDAYIDGVEVDGIGMYGISGRQDDYFWLEPFAVTDESRALFAYASEIQLVFLVYDGQTYEDLFTQSTALYAD